MSLVSHSIDSHGVVTITLNDEANLNAMSEEMAAQFSSLIADLRSNKSVNVIILSGAGRSFSAGGHLEMLDAKRSNSKEVVSPVLRIFVSLQAIQS